MFPKRFTVELYEDGARWLAKEARDQFATSRDYAWLEIADQLDDQLRGWDASDG